MPDQFVSPSNHRSKQLRQVDQSSSTFTCPRCASDIRTSHFCTNCCSAVREVQAAVLSHDTTSKSVDKARESAVFDHLASKLEAVKYCGTDEDACCFFDTISKPAVVECSETWVNEPTAALTRCTEQTVSGPDSSHADEAARHIELESQHAAFHHAPSRSSPSTSCAGRERPERSCRKTRSSSVKLQEKNNSEPAPAGTVAVRSSGKQTRTRRTRSKLEEHGYYGVRTRRGVKGFLVEIRPQKSKKTIWLGTYDTAIEAAAAYNAGVFYTDKPKKKYNLQNVKFLFPPLPSHLDIRSSSPEVMKEVKKFVKKQAKDASYLVKDHGSNRCASGNGGSLDMQAMVSRPPVLQPGLAEVTSYQAVPIINARLSDVPESFSPAAAAAAAAYPNRESDFQVDLGFLYGTALQYRGLPIVPDQQEATLWIPEPSSQLPAANFKDIIPALNNNNNSNDSCNLQQLDYQDLFDTEFKYQTSTTIAATSNLGMLQQQQQLATGTWMNTATMNRNNNNSGIRYTTTGCKTMFHLLQQQQQQQQQEMEFSITLQNLHQQLTELQEPEFDNSHINFFTQC